MVLAARLALVLVCSTFFITVSQARELKVYRGEPTPPALMLKDLQGKVRSLSEFRGQVVMLNFWAAWCPPCRIEMPSMWRLQNKLQGEPFQVVAVDMGEEEKIIRAFLPDEMERDFVVLMDKDGAALKAWKVFAFPTSYIIDKQGRIRYALFGELQWDTPEVIQKIKALLKE
ncbi:MAG: TlpA disulfide reductase family protein [Gammaproteobacteria bacterium]|nr:MAG: TlpA disulfide reductase family protein [Gammaproteobacteria bacterium]